MAELMARAEELADGFKGYDPSEEDRAEAGLPALRRTAYQRALLERELLAAVRSARAAAASWAEVGEELGTSGGAARQRYADDVEG